MRDCNVFVDANGNTVFDPSTEYSSTTNGVGSYSIVYPPDDTGYVHTEAANGLLCQDTISLQTGGETGHAAIKSSFDNTFLRTTTEASMSTPFTTIATEMMSEGLVADEAAAAAAVCAYMIPCIPCEIAEFTFHACTASNCREVCTSQHGSLYSPFTLDALRMLLLGDIQDETYALWMVYQYATMNAISCAQTAMSGTDGKLVFDAMISVFATKVANQEVFDLCYEDGMYVIDMILESAQLLDNAQLLEEPPTSASIAAAASTCGQANAYIFANTLSALHPSSTTLPDHPYTSSSTRSFPSQPTNIQVGTAPITQAFTNHSLTTVERIKLLFGSVPSEFYGCMDASATNYDPFAILQSEGQACHYN
jgi:hypothetical protein